MDIRPLVLLVAACAAAPTSPPPAAPPGSGAAAETQPLYTPAQLREAMPVGHEIVYRIEAGAKPAVVERWIVTATDAVAMRMTLLERR